MRQPITFKQMEIHVVPYYEYASSVVTYHHERVGEFAEDGLLIEHVAVVSLIVVLVHLLFQGYGQLAVACILLNLLQLDSETHSVHHLV